MATDKFGKTETKHRNDGLVTVEYLFNRYPELEEKLRWTPRTVGWLLSANVISGTRTSKNVVLIDEKSIMGLCTYLNACIEQRKINFKQ